MREVTLVRGGFWFGLLLMSASCGSSDAAPSGMDTSVTTGATAAASATSSTAAATAGAKSTAPAGSAASGRSGANAGKVGADSGGGGAVALADMVMGAGSAGRAGASEAGATQGSGGAGGAAMDAAGAVAAAGAAAAADSGARAPDTKFLVPASGPCPEFRDGYVMFAPDGVQRRVLLYATTKPNMKGPLIISWHSTLPNPEDAVSWIGQRVIDDIKAQGGIVAAPASAHPNDRRPWDNIPLGAMNTDNDQRLMDEIVACAVEKVGIDVRRIHATGMSAGGLKTAQVSLRRSGYLASVVVYSGGLTEGDEPPDQDPTNPVAAMILYGGATDISPVDGIDYTQASNRYLERMKARGSFAFLCNHGGGHSVPQDSQASAFQFLTDHPFGTSPSPYAMGLPDGFLRYCKLSQ
jgi:poly(3-hydroxybutyrate) depolymerase